MRLYQNGLQLPVKQDTPYIDTKRRVCIAVRVSGGADENGNDLDVSSKQRASVSFRCLLFPYTRCEALALKWSERADKEFLFLCCPHLSILIGKLINICTSGCQLLTVKFCYKAHFSSIISYNYCSIQMIIIAVCAFGSRSLGSCKAPRGYSPTLQMITTAELQDTITWLLSQPSFWVPGLKIACLRQGPEPSLISFFKNVVVFDCCSYLFI